jgi:NAD-dependent deacetylase
MGVETKLPIDDRTSVLVLTGAGVSAESGIATFRGAGGLWENHRIEEVASPDAFASDPRMVWRFYSERRQKAALCSPNPAHRALVSLEARLGDRFLLATQNVDGLHRKAGSQRLIELHGNLFTSRCSSCARAPFTDDRLHLDALPECEQCKGLLRPHIVWFGEMLDPANLEAVERFAGQASKGRFLFLAIGTSGVVWPAAGFVDLARRAGAETWLVNAEEPENVGRFQHFIEGKSGELLPGLLGTS